MTTPTSLPAPLHWFAALLATVALYYLGGRLGLAVPYVGSHISLIWPPTGIALAALLRWGPRVWPGVWLGAFLVNLSVGSGIALAAGIACGNTLGPWLAAWLLQRRGFRPQMERRRDLLAYLGIAVIACMGINASNGALNLWLAGLLPGDRVAGAWAFWWLGDSVGALIVGVPLLTFFPRVLKPAFCCWRGVETLAVMTVSVAAATWLFSAGADVTPAHPLMYVPFLLLGWLALRSGIWPASFTALLLSAIAAWHTAQGHGPFQQGDTHQGLALLWSYMASMSVITTLVTVVIAELKAREQQFQQMFQRHEAIMLLIAPHSGHIVDANPSAEKFYGYPHDRLCEMHIQEINALPPDQVACERQQALRETRNSFVFPHRLANGEIRTVEVHSSPVEGADGETLLFSIIHDITERRRAEEALRNSEERLFLVLRGTNDGMWDWDLQRNTIYYSERWWTMLGYRDGELDDGPELWRRLMHPNDLLRIDRAIEVALAGGAKAFQEEFRLRHKDGHYVPVCSRGSILHDAAGKPIRMSGANMDLTERKQTEEQLRRERDFAEGLVNTAQTIVVVLDPVGRIIRINPYMETISGYSQSEVQGLDWFATFLPEREQECLRAMFLGAINDIQTRGSVNPIVTRNGQERFIEWYDKTLKDADGKTVGLLAIGQDITERRHAEEAAKSREKDHLLIQQSRLAAMGEMIGNIAHQWRQPINALNLLLINIKDAYDFGELTDTELERQVRTGTALIQRMSTTIDDFRNFFRPNKEKAPFSLLHALADVDEILGAGLMNHGIALERDIPADITVNGYANEYSQMLLNLINNASEAIQTRGIENGRIRVTMHEENGMAVTTVSDNGGGIPEDVLPRIFDPYFTTKSKGTGIGLYMAKAIVENNMGGSIDVCNGERGAQFTVKVPVGEAGKDEGGRVKTEG